MKVVVDIRKEILRQLVKIEDEDKEVWSLCKTLARSDNKLSEETKEELKRLIVIYPEERDKLIKTLKKAIKEGEGNA